MNVILSKGQPLKYFETFTGISGLSTVTLGHLPKTTSGMVAFWDGIPQILGSAYTVDLLTGIITFAQDLVPDNIIQVWYEGK